MESIINIVSGVTEGVAQLIEVWRKKGMADEEIVKRLSDPASVERELWERALARREAGKDFLGRDPA